MITTALVVLGVGSLLGGTLGWKLGRTYERARTSGGPKPARDKTPGNRGKGSR